MSYKCKICGGQTTVDTQNGIAICDYCGTKQALLLFTNDSERLLYESGNNYLLHSEYDKAENVFNQLLTIKPNAAELYWDLVLCKYGVTYVKDPRTDKYIPTCNRTHYTPIFSDENYQKVIELSSGEKKELFEEDAKTIDNIQKGIIAVSKKEKPFDVFISYKETDANGNRTKDSVESQKLYEKLTEAGYKVFFARITLEDKVGTEYEPYIYAALHSSKVMLTVCSSKENIEAVWVKNEWGRFLSLQQKDAQKTMIPLYFDMEKNELPEEFTLLSSYDMSVDGFLEELLRGVKKLIPMPIMKAKRRKQIAKISGIALATVVVALGISAAIIVPKELEQRRIRAEEALHEKAYQEARRLFESGEYDKAEEAFKALGDYKDSVHMAERCPIQPKYDAAMKLYYDGEYAQASWAFAALSDYEDAKEMKMKSEKSWRVSLANVAIENTQGSYFVGANGTINSFDYSPGKLMKKISIEEHGQVVSLGGNPRILSDDETLEDTFVALHEDGYVTNANCGNDNSKEWNDIVQISQGFNCTHIGLRADGTMVHEPLLKADISDEWIAKVEDWKNVVAFDTATETLDGGMFYWGAVVAVKADGTLYSTFGSHFKEEEQQRARYVQKAEEFMATINNAKAVDVYFSSSGIEEEMICVTVITKDNTIIRYQSGKAQTYAAEDIINIKESSCGRVLNTYRVAYVLTSQGELKLLGDDNTIISDVVYLSGPFAVTRSGSIYLFDRYNYDFAYDGKDPMKTEAKTRVYDEWLGRLK